MQQKAQDEITQFFRQIVAAVNAAVSDLGIGDEPAWDLARKLHALWRESLRRADAAPPRSGSSSKGHPAMEDLLQMIDVEEHE